MRSLLSRHALDRFTWVMNRDAFYRLRERELDVDLGPSPDAISPEYARSPASAPSPTRARSTAAASYLCVYELFNLEDRSVLWTDKYEVKKSAVKGFWIEGCLD